MHLNKDISRQIVSVNDVLGLLHMHEVLENSGFFFCFVFLIFFLLVVFSVFVFTEYLKMKTAKSHDIVSIKTEQF